MAVPGLSEILSVPVDPERATGKPAVVFDTKPAVQAITQAAQYKAENDHRNYSMFLNNLKDVYKNLEDTNALEVATPDRKYLREQALGIYKDISKNPSSIYSPEINDRLGKLKSDATESKQNLFFDKAHRQYMLQNPELNTEENQSAVSNYWNQPLGKRSPYMLNMPTVFDYEKFKNDLLAHPTVKTKFAQAGTIGGYDPKTGAPVAGDQFIRELEGNKYNRDRFLQLWNGGLYTQKDKYGHSIRGYASQAMKELPAAMQDYYKKNGGIEKFWDDIGQQAFGSGEDINEVIKDNLQPNPNFAKKQEIAQGWARIGIEQDKLNKSKQEDLFGADAVLKEAASIINNGVERNVNNYKNTGKDKKVLEVSDPTLLKTFGNIDRDGNTINVPDVVQYNKDSDELDLVYFEKEKDPYGRITGGIKYINGKRVIDEVKSLNARTWLKEKVKQSFPNKDIGGVNSLVEQVFTKSGGNLKSLSDLYFGDKNNSADIPLPKGQPQTVEQNGFTYTWNPKTGKYE